MYTFSMNSTVANNHQFICAVDRDLFWELINKFGQKDLLPRQRQISCQSISLIQFDRLET